MATLALYEPNLGRLDLSPSNGIIVEGFDPGFPRVRENSYDEPNADGSYDQTQFVGERIVSIDMVIVPVPAASTTKTQIRRAIMQYLHPRQRSVLKVVWEPGGEEQEVVIRTQDQRMPIDSWSHRKVNLTFKAQPYFQSPVLSGTAEDASESVSSPLTFPITFPFDFGGVGVTSYINISNTGDAPLWPTFQILGPITDPRIKNVTSGEELVFENLSLAADDRLYIDMQRSTVRFNNVEDYSVYVDYETSEWWSCDIGINQVSLEGTDTAAATGLYAFWQIPYL